MNNTTDWLEFTPSSSNVVTSLALTITVVCEYKLFEVTYLPAISVDKFKTPARFVVSLVNVELLIVILAKSESQVASMPWAANASIKPWMVIVFVTFIVLLWPLASNTAVPSAFNPNVSNVVDNVASTTLVTECVRTLEREYADATAVWSTDIEAAPYKHVNKFVPFL